MEAGHAGHDRAVDWHDARFRGRHRGRGDTGADRLGAVRGVDPAMTRPLALLYGAACYLIAGFAVLYSAAFLNDVAVPHSLNRGPESPPALALLVNLALLALFGLQHSGMARQSFKRYWTRIVHPPIERSSYVLSSSLALVLLCLMWRPLPA